MRRPGVRIPSRPPSFKTTSSVPNSSYRGTLGLSSLPDSFRYLVIHQERHCLSAASSVKTSRLGLVGTDPHVAIWITLGLSSLPDSFRYLVIHPEQHCLSAASSVKTSRLGLVGTDPHVAIWIPGSRYSLNSWMLA